MNDKPRNPTREELRAAEDSYRDKIDRMTAQEVVEEGDRLGEQLAGQVATLLAAAHEHFSQTCSISIEDSVPQISIELNMDCETSRTLVMDFITLAMLSGYLQEGRSAADNLQARNN